MRINLLFSFLLCLLASTMLNGQITLTANQFPKPKGIDTVLSTINTFSFSEPSHGANQLWDYSGLQAVTPNYTQLMEDTAHPIFVNANYQRESFYALQNFAFRAHDHFVWNDTGIVQVGRTQFDSTFSINDITGGTEDEVHFTEEDIRFSKRKAMQLPLHYNDEWSGVDTQSTHFEITVIASGLNQVPSEIVNYRYHTNSVVGWGQLQLPPANGVPTPPKPALLLQRTDSIIDSIFVMGAPASAQFLAGLGATQGQTNVVKTYEFYVLGFGQPAISVTYDPQAIDRIDFRPKAARALPSEVSEKTKQPGVQVFPTMVSPNGNFSLQTERARGEAVLFDSRGREVWTQPILSQTTTLTAPAVRGSYFLRVVDEKGIPFYVEQLMVK